MDTQDPIVEMVNSVEVTADELWQVNEEANAALEADPSHPGAIFLVGNLFRGDFRKAAAVFFRMQALCDLIQPKEGLRGWTLPRLPDGGVPTEETVFAAAAVQPLIDAGGTIIFEREAFLGKVLELATLEMQG